MTTKFFLFIKSKIHKTKVSLSLIGFVYFISPLELNSSIMIPTVESFQVLMTWIITNFQIMLLFLFSFAILLLFIELHNYKVALKSNVKRFSELELKSLRLQINPHFLSNSLLGLQGLILRKEITESYESVGRFGRFMRDILIHSEKDYISLEEEVRIISEYVKLESSLRSLQINFKIDILGKIKRDIKGNEYIPTLILQPIIENCFNHAFVSNENKEYSVKVEFSFNQNSLDISVCDNGVGYNAKKVNNEGGFGLVNLRKRMLTYSEMLKQECSIEIKAIKDKNNQLQGTIVKVKVPYLKSIR